MGRPPLAAVREALGRFRRNRREARAARGNRARGTHCYYCGVAFGAEAGTARTVDHRVPRGAGGTEGLVNLVFACQACNQRKADTPEGAFVGSAWLARRRREVAPTAAGPAADVPGARRPRPDR